MKLLSELLLEAQYPTFPLFKVFYIAGIRGIAFLPLSGEPTNHELPDRKIINDGLYDIIKGKRTPDEAARDVEDYMNMVPSASKRISKYKIPPGTKVTKNVLGLFLIRPMLWAVHYHGDDELGRLLSKMLDNDMNVMMTNRFDIMEYQHKLIDAGFGEYVEGDL